MILHWPKVAHTDMVALCGVLVVPGALTIDTAMVTCRRCRRMKAYRKAFEEQAA